MSDADQDRQRSTKLAKFDVMIGYPDKLRDYSALTIEADDLYGNVKRARPSSGTTTWPVSASRSTARSGA